MNKFFKNIVAYITPDEKATIGLTSFKERKSFIKPAQRPKIKDTSTLRLNLLHK